MLFRSKEEWKAAMKDEISSLHKNNTYQLVKRPRQQRVLKNKWVYKVNFYSFSETSALVKHRVRRGTGLERLTKTLGTKVTIQIAEGMKRLEKPLHAAKFASEGGFIARKHTPVLPHFKEYKKDTSLIKDYVGKVTVSYLLCS